MARNPGVSPSRCTPSVSRRSRSARSTGAARPTAGDFAALVATETRLDELLHEVRGEARAIIENATRHAEATDTALEREVDGRAERARAAIELERDRALEEIASDVRKQVSTFEAVSDVRIETLIARLLEPVIGVAEGRR